MRAHPGNRALAPWTEVEEPILPAFFFGRGGIVLVAIVVGGRAVGLFVLALNLILPGGGGAGWRGELVAEAGGGQIGLRLRGSPRRAQMPSAAQVFPLPCTSQHMLQGFFRGGYWADPEVHSGGAIFRMFLPSQQRPADIRGQSRLDTWAALIRTA